MAGLNHSSRKPDPLPDPQTLPKAAQDALEALMGLPAEEAATLVRSALESDAVRKAFLEKFVTVSSGVAVGERGDLALYLSRYYNAPVACQVAITRNDPETGERQLLVGERDNGDKTIIGGHFSPFTAQECWDYFFKRNFSVEELHHYFRKMTPPATPTEDATTKDIDLLAAVSKEMIQEARIFLMPKGLSPNEKNDLHKRVKAAFGDDVAISYDYDIVDHNTLWSAVGSAGKGWHSLIIGYGVMLHDQQALNKPGAGDDIAKTYWVAQSQLSTLSSKEAREAGNFDGKKTYLGDMKYGEKPIVTEAWAAMDAEIPQAIYDENGREILRATKLEIYNIIREIGGKFNVLGDELIGQKSGVTGAAASERFAKGERFIRLHDRLIGQPHGTNPVADLQNLFAAEKQMLKAFIQQEKLPETLLQQVEETAFADYQKRLADSMAGHAGRVVQSRSVGNSHSR